MTKQEMQEMIEDVCNELLIFEPITKQQMIEEINNLFNSLKIN